MKYISLVIGFKISLLLYTNIIILNNWFLPVEFYWTTIFIILNGLAIISYVFYIKNKVSKLLTDYIIPFVISSISIVIIELSMSFINKNLSILLLNYINYIYFINIIISIVLFVLLYYDIKIQILNNKIESIENI